MPRKYKPNLAEKLMTWFLAACILAMVAGVIKVGLMSQSVYEKAKALETRYITTFEGMDFHEDGEGSFNVSEKRIFNTDINEVD